MQERTKRPLRAPIDINGKGACLRKDAEQSMNRNGKRKHQQNEAHDSGDTHHQRANESAGTRRPIPDWVLFTLRSSTVLVAVSITANQDREPDAGCDGKQRKHHADSDSSPAEFDTICLEKSKKAIRPLLRQRFFGRIFCARVPLQKQKQ